MAHLAVADINGIKNVPKDLFGQAGKCIGVESLQSHMILTMSHWSSGLTCLLPATRVTGSNPPGGTYVKSGFSC